MVKWREVLRFFRTARSRRLGQELRRNPNASVRFGKCSMKAVARVLDYRKEWQLWDEVQVIANHKYGWGDGLPTEITPVEGHRR